MPDSTQTEFDFIVVGAGSAGCVLANRLSESGRYSVLLLEAGGSDAKFWIQVPLGYGKTYYQPSVNWMYTSEASAGLNNRSSYWPRGKVMGGSSSINAMVHIRGHPDDFNAWEAMGNSGWGWDDVLPVFKKSETFADGGNDFRGGSGPLHIASMEHDIHPLCQSFFAAGQDLQFALNHDFNGHTQEGLGTYQTTTKGGLRMSTARAYIKTARARANLSIRKNALATRILFKDKRACGLLYNDSNDRQSKQVNARREVILSAGAINSPQLLQLSGIGPGNLLQSYGIEVIHDARSVGQHLQDHLFIDHVYRSRVPTLNDQLNHLHGRLWQGLRYLLTRKGALARGINQVGGFVASRPDLKRPNMQLFFSPLSYTRAPSDERALLKPDPFSGFVMTAQPTRPSSRGYLQIQSADPFKPPAIYPDYLSTEFDVQEILEASQLLRKLANTPALSDIIDREILPGPKVQSKDALLEDCRARADTIYHPVGTCSMGSDPDSNVVDARLKVYGVEGLRVADASIFPTLTSGNTNAPVVMVGEKAAAMILED